MAKLHHTVRKVAVKTYSALQAEGKTADEIKTAIASDEKKFDEDQVNEIYEAIVNPEKDDENAVYTVVSEFRAKGSFDQVHKVGDDVSLFDKERIAKLVERGLIAKAE